jgi:hypothetical protein
MDAIEERKVGRLTVKVFRDQDPESPREWDNLGTMACWHRRYRLGDKHGFREPADFQEWAKGRDLVLLPLYLYDHSGITMNTTGFSCPWDSGQVGWIYVERAKVLKEWGRKRWTAALRRKAENVLRQEVNAYDDYLTGNVRGFVVEDEAGAHVDSCWGFYGEPEYCMRQGVAAAEAALEGEAAPA